MQPTQREVVVHFVDFELELGQRRRTELAGAHLGAQRPRSRRRLLDAISVMDVVDRGFGLVGADGEQISSMANL